MPTITDMLSQGSSFPIWDKRRWSQDARIADAISVYQKQKEFDEASADKELARRKALIETEYGLRGGNEKASDLRVAERMLAEDDRRGLTAEGDMRKTRSKEFIAGSPSRMRVQDIMGTAAEDEALAHKIVAGQNLARTPSLNSAKLNAEQAKLGESISTSTFNQQNPGIAYQIEALKTLGSNETARKVAETDAASRVKAAEIANPPAQQDLRSQVAGSRPGSINLRALAAKARPNSGETVNAPQEFTTDESMQMLGKLVKQLLGGKLSVNPEP